MGKLYDITRTEDDNIEIGKVIPLESKEDSTEEINFEELNNHVYAYRSLGTVYDQVVSESFSFIDKNNYVLYNEYVKVISDRLGVGRPVQIAEETIELLPTAAINHHISLEGFITDLWNKIKSIFKKIYDTIAAFFKRWFTQMGRYKARLKNLKETLSKTDKDIGTLNLEKVPGGVASAFSGKDETITTSYVETVLNNVSGLTKALVGINSKATAMAKFEVVDANFVTQIKKLAAQSEEASKKIKENNANKDKGRLWGEKNNDKNKALNKENESLASIKKNADNEVIDKVDEMEDINDSNKDISLGSDDVALDKARKEFNDLMNDIVKSFEAVKGKPLTKGKTLTKVSAKEDEGIELEFDDEFNKPTEVRLADKSTLSNLINTSISILNEAEKVSGKYTQVNDAVMKSLDAIDRVIKDIDIIGEKSELGKYKKIANTKIRTRLNLMKNFFNDYNKVNKNVLEMTMTTVGGVCDYTVLCLKYFE